jgi:hypothetical protein
VHVVEAMQKQTELSLQGSDLLVQFTEMWEAACQPTHTMPISCHARQGVVQISHSYDICPKADFRAAYYTTKAFALDFASAGDFEA